MKQQRFLCFIGISEKPTPKMSASESANRRYAELSRISTLAWIDDTADDKDSIANIDRAFGNNTEIMILPFVFCIKKRGSFFNSKTIFTELNRNTHTAPCV